MDRKLIVGLIGKDGRTTAIAKKLRESERVERVISMSSGKNAGRGLIEEVLENAKLHRPDFVFVSPEEPLYLGVVDKLREIGTPSIGPVKSLARIESSKSFTRELLSEFQIPGNPEYRIFRDLNGMREYLKELNGFVVKPDGLTGGKGVKVSGEHLNVENPIEDALKYSGEIFEKGHTAVVIEEKLEGEEFSLQSFCDGVNVAHMPIVQDHKRALVGDSGDNTGGMGSYSCENHILPFLRPEEVKRAQEINERVAAALLSKCGGEKYKGILYGGFMATADGVRVIEYNARFGDPEALNISAILKTDFAEICEAIINGKLGSLKITFAPRATVCKYVVPEGYPGSPKKNEIIDLAGVDSESDVLKIYEAAVEPLDQRRYNLAGSRAIAFVGIGNNVHEAEKVAEKAASAVRGPVYHREDIGTEALIAKRVRHMKNLMPTNPLGTTVSVAR